MECKICGKTIRKKEYEEFEVCSKKCQYDDYWNNLVEMYNENKTKEGFIIVASRGICYMFKPGYNNCKDIQTDGHTYGILIDKGSEPGKLYYTNCLVRKGFIPRRYRNKIIDNAWIKIVPIQAPLQIDKGVC